MAETEVTDPDYGLIDMPEISDTVCYELYMSFYNGITKSQDGDAKISLDTRIRNVSYVLAEPIARYAGTGGGTVDPGDIVLTNYVKRSGDSMSGYLYANMSFQMGEDGKIIAKTVKDSVLPYLQFDGGLKVNGASFYIDGRNMFTMSENGLTIDGGDTVSFGASNIETNGYLLLGEDMAHGFYASPTQISFQNYTIYHSGNSNKPEMDWSMGNASVGKDLTVTGNGTISGQFSALGGAVIGYDNEAVVDVKDGKAEIIGDIDLLSLNGPVGIMFDSKYVISGRPENHDNIQISTPEDGALILGGESTESIRLWATLSTENGNDLIDKFGNATFMNTFAAGFGNGGALIKTFADGLTVYNQLRFGDDHGPYFIGDGNNLSFRHEFTRENDEVLTHSCDFRYGVSTSIYTELEGYSETLFINTTADFFTLNKPIEAAEFLGITESTTRLYDNTLFFTEDHYLLNIEGGIRYFGDAYFMGDLFSERFSTGFAGEGFGIRKRPSDGNYEITTDYLVVRKKISAYEYEIRKISAVNGSLWVSDSCSGDTVTTVE